MGNPSSKNRIDGGMELEAPDVAGSLIDLTY